MTSSLARIAAVLVVGLVVAADAQTLRPSRSAEDPEYEVLRAATVFRTGPVGYAGVISNEEGALNRLVSGPNAASNLRRLVSEATLAGQLYAVWGLWTVRDPDFEKFTAAFASRDANVKTQRGCIVGSDAVSVVVERIRSGEFGQPEPAIGGLPAS